MLPLTFLTGVAGVLAVDLPHLGLVMLGVTFRECLVLGPPSSWVKVGNSTGGRARMLLELSATTTEEDAVLRTG